MVDTANAFDLDEGCSESWIVIVDDHPSLRTLLKCLLECEGCVVTDFSRARDALDYLEMSPRVPALVITDLHLPGMNGLELALTMKASSKLARVPIVLVTGASSDALGVEDVEVMYKPVDAEALLAHVRRVRAPVAG